MCEPIPILSMEKTIYREDELADGPIGLYYLSKFPEADFNIFKPYLSNKNDCECDLLYIQNTLMKDRFWAISFNRQYANVKVSLRTLTDTDKFLYVVSKENTSIHSITRLIRDEVNKLTKDWIEVEEYSSCCLIPSPPCIYYKPNGHDFTNAYLQQRIIETVLM